MWHSACVYCHLLRSIASSTIPSPPSVYHVSPAAPFAWSHCPIARARAHGPHLPLSMSKSRHMPSCSYPPLLWFFCDSRRRLASSETPFLNFTRSPRNNFGFFELGDRVSVSTLYCNCSLLFSIVVWQILSMVLLLFALNPTSPWSFDIPDLFWIVRFIVCRALTLERGSSEIVLAVVECSDPMFSKEQQSDLRHSQLLP